jgi:hypothetical protein
VVLAIQNGSGSSRAQVLDDCAFCEARAVQDASTVLRFTVDQGIRACGRSNVHVSTHCTCGNARVHSSETFFTVAGMFETQKESFHGGCHRLENDLSVLLLKGADRTNITN